MLVNQTLTPILLLINYVHLGMSIDPTELIRYYSGQGKIRDLAQERWYGVH
jgi:hypothetical protein